MAEFKIELSNSYIVFKKKKSKSPDNLEQELCDYTKQLRTDFSKPTFVFACMKINCIFYRQTSKYVINMFNMKKLQ